MPGEIRVVGVADGDTIMVLHLKDKRQEKIRLATIDAPELHQAFGNASKQSLSDLVFGKDVKIRKISADRYGRTVAEVFVGDIDVNIEQLKRGYAWYFLRYKTQQTFEERRKYFAAEKFAKENKNGLWSDLNPEPPWDFRKARSQKGNIETEQKQPPSEKLYE